MTDQEAATHHQDLLSLAAVSHIALIVDASGVVASACSIPHPTRDKSDLTINAGELSASLREVTLH